MKMVWQFGNVGMAATSGIGIPLDGFDDQPEIERENETGARRPTGQINHRHPARRQAKAVMSPANQQPAIPAVRWLQ